MTVRAHLRGIVAALRSRNPGERIGAAICAPCDYATFLVAAGALACPDCARDDGRATALTHAERCDQCLSIVVEMVLYPPTAGGVAARALDGGGR